MHVTDRELADLFATGTSMKAVAALTAVPRESVEARLRDRFRRMRLRPRVHARGRYVLSLCGRENNQTADADMVTCRKCLRVLEAAERDE